MCIKTIWNFIIYIYKKNYIIYIPGPGGSGDPSPVPGPGPALCKPGIPAPATRFSGEYPAPFGSGEPGSPPGRVKSPSLPTARDFLILNLLLNQIIVLKSSNKCGE